MPWSSKNMLTFNYEPSVSLSKLETIAIRHWRLIHWLGNNMNRTSLFLALILSVSSTWFAGAFQPVSLLSQPIKFPIRTYVTQSDGSMDGSDLVARRIIVTGDVNGGYYRSCVKNEVRLRSWFLMRWWILSSTLMLSFSRRVVSEDLWVRWLLQTTAKKRRFM